MVRHHAQQHPAISRCAGENDIPAFCHRPLGSQTMSLANVLSHTSTSTHWPTPHLQPHKLASLHTQSQAATYPRARCTPGMGPASHSLQRCAVTYTPFQKPPTTQHKQNPTPSHRDPVQCPPTSRSTQPLPAPTCGSSQARRAKPGDSNSTRGVSLYFQHCVLVVREDAREKPALGH